MGEVSLGFFKPSRIRYYILTSFIIIIHVCEFPMTMKSIDSRINAAVNSVSLRKARRQTVKTPTLQVPKSHKISEPGCVYETTKRACPGDAMRVVLTTPMGGDLEWYSNSGLRKEHIPEEKYFTYYCAKYWNLLGAYSKQNLCSTRAELEDFLEIIFRSRH